MKTKSEIFIAIITLLGLIIAILAWLIPFSPVGSSPFLSNNNDPSKIPINNTKPSLQSSISQAESDNKIEDNFEFFFEDFEAGETDKIRFTTGNWLIVDDDNGNKVLEGNNMEYNGNDWPRIDLLSPLRTDYSIEYYIRYIDYDLSSETGSGMAWLGFRENKDGTYVFAFVPYWQQCEFNFYDPNTPEWIQIDSKNYNFQKYTWYKVRTEIHSSNIKIFVDDNLIFHLEDSKLSNGGIHIHTGPNTIIQLDNLRISE